MKNVNIISSHSSELEEGPNSSVCMSTQYMSTSRQRYHPPHSTQFPFSYETTLAALAFIYMYIHKIPTLLQSVRGRGRGREGGRWEGGRRMNGWREE